MGASTGDTVIENTTFSEMHCASSGCRLPRLMTDINRAANGDNPVTRRECGLIHDTLVEEVRMQVRHLKWYIGGVTGILTTLVVVSVGLLQSTLPKEIPPNWFLNRVERLEMEMHREIKRIDNEFEGLRGK